ncbi:uncharacterized protein LOC116342209 [Contarinia nasturtii]|uniref:uncharacterized protein LOC116342209 n=1 Tax=Contarinia nasturtii TaxID=265458 RepID=UPI0012D4A9F3|nr:uncharacterized protein LOC116342209 [Contarinia nasturtii]
MDSEFSANTLKVFFNFIEDDDDENNYSAYTFVSTAMLMVINMFANDLKVPVDYLNKISVSRNTSIDIFINLDENDGIYNSSFVENIWPHYQNRYCLIYANTKIMSPSTILNFSSTLIIMNSIILLINMIFFYLVFRHRMRHSIDEAFAQSFTFTVQSQLMLAIPMFSTTIHEKWFLAFKFIQNFLMGTILLSVFTTQIISPPISLVSDAEISRFKSYTPGPITFGIGEPCLYELKQGLYLRRGCFLSCDVANKTVERHDGVVFLKEDINFQQVFKVSKGSMHYDTIKMLVRHYFEAGILDRIFNQIHGTSYKFLEETGYGNQIELKDLYDASSHMIFVGYCVSIITFICEIIYFRWQCARNHNRKTIKRVRFLH